jgi:hypothetical protein
MKHAVKLTFGLLVLCALALTSAPAQAATAVGPYYAWPSWDQTLQCDTPATCPRFIVLTNFSSNAVLDRETGLVWERSPDTNTRDWLFAHLYCNQRSVGNRKGWRLPTIQELASLIDPSVAFPGPTLPVGHPFTNVQSSGYWSATTSPAVASDAWVASLRDGGVFVVVKSLSLFVWCARGGQGVDPQ